MANDEEHFFMCLLAICMSSLEKCLFLSSSCPFFGMIICFVCVEFEEFFIDLGYQPFDFGVICKYLPHSVGCLFVLLTVSFAVQKLLILMKSGKFTFSFVSSAFGDIS